MSEPKHQMLKSAGNLSMPEALTTNAVVPLLDEPSFHALTLSCKHYRKQYKDKYADKKVAAEMLHCVLNPTEDNQTQFLELLSVPKKDLNGLPLYLIQNHGEEVYFNIARVRKTKTIRYNTNVLEAVLRTSNFHLAKPLFNCIQAQEKTENLKKHIRNIKAQGIWGMPELQAAYKNFLERWQELYDAKNYNELDRLCGRIGQALKEHLPWFSIYLFCHPVTHANANYTQPPNWTCMLWDKTELDLDLFGPDSIYALYKGRADWHVGVNEWNGADARGYPLWLFRAARRGLLLTGISCRGAEAPLGARSDSTSFTSQCEVLSSEMDKTIKQFELGDSELVIATKPALG